MRRHTEQAATQGINLLEVAPEREVGWEEEDGLVVLVRDRPRVRSPRSLGRWISYMMAPPRIRLDELGSFAWLALLLTANVASAQFEFADPWPPPMETTPWERGFEAGRTAEVLFDVEQAFGVHVYQEKIRIHEEAQ